MNNWKVIHCRAREMEAELNKVASEYALHITHIPNENVENPWVTLILLHQRNLQRPNVMPVGGVQFRQ